MFTTRKHLGIGKSEVKWMATGSAPTTVPGTALIQENPIDKAKELLKRIRESIFSKSSELQELKALLMNLDKANTQQKQELQNLLTEELNKDTRSQEVFDTKGREAYYKLPTEGDKKDIRALLADWNNDFNKVDTAKVMATQAVRTETQNSVASLREAKSTIDRLANLDGSSHIEKGTKDIVDEDVLAQALSRATKGGDATQLGEVFTRITGKVPTTYTDAEVKEFQSKLRTSLIVLNQLGGGNAGLNVLLLGKTKEYMDAVAVKVKANGGKPLEIKIADREGMSPEAQTILGALATVGVAVVTGGLGTVGHEAEDMNADSFIKRVQAKGVLSNAGGILSWIKDASMGRKLSLTFGKDKMSVDEFEAKVVDFAKEVVTLDENGDLSKIKNEELRKMYPIVIDIAGKAGVNMQNGKEKIQKALIQAYIQNLGTENQGVDWTFKLGLLFIGANRDNIQTTALRTEGTAYTDIERSVTKRPLTSDELTRARVTITNVGGKWKHTVPKTLKLAGDAEALPVELVEPKIDLEKSDKVYDMHFSDIDGKYKITLTPRSPQPVSGESVVPTGDITKKSQDAQKVVSAREKKEVLKDNTLAAKLFNVVGHSNPKLFQPLLDAVNARDEGAVKSALEGLKKAKYVSLAKELEADIANYQLWTTYMYGSQATRNLDNPSQIGVDKMRTPDVIRAEEKLAKGLGISSSLPESAFNIEGNGTHNPVQLSTSFPGQGITVSVFATPRGGCHRVDSFDGSIALSQQQTKVNNGDYKNQIIDALAKSSGKGGVSKQVEGLNAFLKSNGKNEITTDKYIQFLKDGNTASLGVDGLSVQGGKGTQVFEGRSMIAGNVCMNRAHGIAYPLFELSIPGKKTISQPVNPVATMDYSAAVNAVGVTGVESAIGLSTLGLINKFKPKDTPPSNNNGGPTTNPGDTGKPIGGGVTTNPGAGGTGAGSVGTGGGTNLGGSVNVSQGSGAVVPTGQVVTSAPLVAPTGGTIVVPLPSRILPP